MKRPIKAFSKTIEFLNRSALTAIKGGATDDLWSWRKNIEDGIIDRR
ncbi:MAG: hypothetical protein WBA74_04415 [Cyclobacteriaceae bacterium]